MFDVSEVLKILTASPDNELINDITRISDLLIKSVSKRHMTAEFPVETRGNTSYISNIEIESEYLANLLSGTYKCTVMAATIGIEVDKFIAFRSKISVFDGLIADAVGSAIIEKYCDEIQGDLSHRYSPGYGDFKLETQKKLLSLLNAEKNIGIFLNQQCIMKPRKSITAIMADNIDFDSCEGCLIPCGIFTRKGCGRRRINEQ